MRIFALTMAFLALNSSFAIGFYSLHVGDKSFLIARSNLEKSEYFKIVLNNFSSNVKVDELGVNHLFLQGLPEEFTLIYKFLLYDEIEIKNSEQLKSIERDARFYQIPSLLEFLEKYQREQTDYAWIKVATVQWHVHLKEAWSDLQKMLDKSFANNDRVKISPIGYSKANSLFFVVTKQEKWPVSPWEQSTVWKEKCKMIVQQASKNWTIKLVNELNYKLEEMFKDANQRRLIKVIPQGFTEKNEIVLFVHYKEAIQNSNE